VSDDKFTEETWVYAGQREAVRRGKLNHAWVPDMEHPDTLAHFVKVKGRVVGGIYTVKAERGDDGSPATVYGTPVYTGERIEDVSQLLEWQAQQAAASTSVESWRRQDVDAKNDEFKDLCAPLRDLVRKQIGTARRAGLIAAIIAEVTR